MISKLFESYYNSNFKLSLSEFKRNLHLLNISNQSNFEIENLSSHPSRKLLSVVIVGCRSDLVISKCASAFARKAIEENLQDVVEFVIVRNGYSSKDNALLENAVDGVALTVVTSKENIFPSAARNAAAQLATGEWLYFLDDDAEYSSPIQNLVDLTRKNIHAARGKVVPFNPEIPSPPHYDYGNEEKACHLNIEGNLLFRKSLFDLIGGFDPLIYGHEGIELTGRALQLVPQKNLIYSPQILIKHDPSAGDKMADKKSRFDLNTNYIEYKKSNHIDFQKGLAVIFDPSVEGLDNFLSWTFDSGHRISVDVVVICSDPKKLYNPQYILNPQCKVIFLTSAAALRRAVFLRRYKFFLFSTTIAEVSRGLVKSNISALIQSGNNLKSDFKAKRNLVVMLNPSAMGKTAEEFDIQWGDAIQMVCQLGGRRPATRKNNGRKSDILVCSFHTVDEYYQKYADELKGSLSNLGVAYDIRPITIPNGMKWPEICRKKVQFYYNCFKDNWEKYEKILWIDVDCSLLYVPQFVFDFQVDFMAFRRGFQKSTVQSPVKTRFWEPCFFVFDSNERCLELLEYAAAAEKSNPSLNATDDYFFEEAWRAVGGKLSYFEIPGEMAMIKGRNSKPAIQCRAQNIFFRFGSSGFVDEYKGKVVQHKALENESISFLATARKSQAKPLEYALKIAGAKESDLDCPHKTIYSGLDENHRQLAKSIHAFDKGSTRISLFWWIRPAPGNMGDWLSPYILHKLLGCSIKYAPAKEAQLVSLGSIGRFVLDHHQVWGTGISEAGTVLSKNANYLAVRGPYTAQAIRNSGGKPPEILGDPGILMSVLYKPKTSTEKGRFGFVRHYVHQDSKIPVSDEVDDINILLSSAAEIELFIDRLNRCEAIVTTSLHVCILCNSYKIPCALIEADEPTRGVHGDGVKYRDFFEGAGLKNNPHHQVKKIDPKTITAIANCEYASEDHKKNLMDILLNEHSRKSIIHPL
jgi:hypothetical protein